MSASSMRQLLDLMPAPQSNWQREVSSTLRLLVAEAHALTRLIETLDPPVSMVVRAHLDGRLDEAGFGDMMRSMKGGIQTAAKSAYQGAQAVNNRVNQLGKLLQNTKPVQDFDAQFDNLKSNVAQKYPRLANTLQQYGEFAKSHPKTQAFIIGTLTAMASLAAGPAGGAVAAGLLRAGNELLKGEKASTAIGKTLKTASLGWLAGFGIHQLGAAIAHAAVPFPSNFQTTLDKLMTVKYSYIENGHVLLNVHGITSPEMGTQLSRAFKLFSQAHEAGNDDLAGKFYKIFIDASNQAFDPNGAIQQAIVQDQANDLKTLDMLKASSTAFAGTMSKLAGYVTAGVQGIMAGKPVADQKASIDQPPQASPEQATQAPQTPVQPPVVQPAPSPAPAATPAPRPRDSMNPTDMSLLRRVMNNLRDSGVDTRTPAGQRRLADEYRTAGGGWA